MNFSSLAFLFLFLPITVILYQCIPAKGRYPFLILVSFFFCAVSGPLHAIVLLGSVFVNYILGFLIAKNRGQSKKAKLFLTLSIIINVAFLAFFKYSGLFVSTFSSLTGIRAAFSVALPLGISFYTFHAISFAVDVYRGTPLPGVLNFTTYMVLFPKLIQGPIMPYHQFLPQAHAARSSAEDISRGIRRFLCGLAKKVLIANSLFSLYQQLYEHMSDSGTLGAWFCLVAYSLFIYFDFSGYTDMALGIGNMLGFTLPENFNYPYTSRSISDFWRRWHMTLGSWFRDYLYIPLGGNRKGTLRTVLNLLIVWSLTGFWHGASWNFLLWGIYYFVLLVIEKFLFRGKLEKVRVLNHIYVVFFVCMGWILFSCSDLQAVGAWIKALFTVQNGVVLSQDSMSILFAYLPTICIAVIGCLPYGKRLYNKVLSSRRTAWIDFIVSVIVLVVCVAAIVSGSYSPFLYAAF